METNEDQIWLDALAGKQVKSSDKKLVLTAKLLRRAIQDQQAEEIFEAEQLVRLQNRIHGEGLLERPTLVGVLKKKISKFKLFIIFIVGLISGVFIPMQVATRGGANNFWHSFDAEKATTTLTIHSPQPQNFVREIITTALDDNLTVTISGNDSSTLVIKNFEESKQITTRMKIGLPIQITGEVKINITN